MSPTQRMGAVAADRAAVADYALIGWQQQHIRSSAATTASGSCARA